MVYSLGLSITMRAHFDINFDTDFDTGFDFSLSLLAPLYGIILILGQEESVKVSLKLSLSAEE